MAQPRRNSSEYSGSMSSISSQIKVSDEDKKAAKAKIYRYLITPWMTKVALLPSAALGAGPMLMFLVFGNITTHLTKYYMSVYSGDPWDPMDDIWGEVVLLIIVAVVLMLCKFFDTFFWIRIGSYLSTRIKKELFVNMMKSDVTFFDVNPIGGILTLLSEDAQQVEDAFGQIKGAQVTNLAQFIVGIAMAFAYDWRMALIGLSGLPLIGILMGVIMPGIVRASTARFLHTAESMTIAEETLGSIRTVKGCCREDKEMDRFRHETECAREAEMAIGRRIVVMIGIMQIIMQGLTCLNMWFGATLVEKGDIVSGDMFSVFGYTMFGVMGLITLQGTMQGEQKAIAAGARILKLAEYQPTVPFEGGEILENFRGHISFVNVSFRYPTRDVYVLRNVSFEIKPCQMGALVGHSGSGKSSCVQLLERYYDITEGVILLDGKDIKDLDPHWLHKRIALVQQEPTLFMMSIKDNIKYGTAEATDADVFAAADVANARKFVEKLDHKFDQLVGEKGASLSGGQRQRVAIARAVIKNPTILITDEATSALDADSEKKVQLALDKVMKDRTAVVVAHRLSTVRHAHVIYVFDAGEIKESGTHDELLALGGSYYNLVKRQLTQEQKVKEKSQVAVAHADGDKEKPPADEGKAEQISSDNGESS